MIRRWTDVRGVAHVAIRESGSFEGTLCGSTASGEHELPMGTFASDCYTCHDMWTEMIAHLRNKYYER